MDISQSNWNEQDASNSAAAPDGSPEGMPPSGINDVLRAHQGAVKRFWNKINAVKTTAGSASAYTLAYDVAPGAYYDGEIISFVVNATNAAAATLNVNALGAVPLRLFAGNLLAGALLTDQIAQARYNSSAGAFDLIPQNCWVRLGEQDPSAAATVDFTSIPAGVNHLRCVFDLDPATDAASLNLRTYGADGVLDSGSTDYAFALLIPTALSTTSNSGSGGGASAIALSNGATIDNGSAGISGEISAANIQAATWTKFVIAASYLDSAGSLFVNVTGSGTRSEADRITGLRLFFLSGNMTGKVTLYAGA